MVIKLAQVESMMKMKLLNLLLLIMVDLALMLGDKESPQ